MTPSSKALDAAQWWNEMEAKCKWISDTMCENKIILSKSTYTVSNIERLNGMKWLSSQKELKMTWNDCPILNNEIIFSRASIRIIIAAALKYDND